MLHAWHRGSAMCYYNPQKPRVSDITISFIVIFLTTDVAQSTTHSPHSFSSLHETLDVRPWGRHKKVTSTGTSPSREFHSKWRMEGTHGWKWKNHTSITRSVLPNSNHISGPYEKLLGESRGQRLPWWSSGWDSVLPMQGAWVWSLVRELNPCRS